VARLASCSFRSPTLNESPNAYPLADGRACDIKVGAAAPVRAVRHERSVVPLFGRIWALGSFLCTIVPKPSPEPEYSPKRPVLREPVSGQVRVGLTGPGHDGSRRRFGGWL
jgi:hypothetical protein